MSSSLKTELADHIYQYLCHEAQYSDLPEAARESLTAASECIEQAYKLNVNNSTNNNVKSQSDCLGGASRSANSPSSSILPDELLRIFTRHKEFLSQTKDSIAKYSLRTENESSSIEKPDIRVNSHPLTTNINDPHHNTNNPNTSALSHHHQLNTLNNASNATQVSGANVSGQQQQMQSQQQQQQQQQTSIKQHSQHTISQLPMTTRKKLSHLRAQIKRQASKAARSRLEKRSSVSGPATGSGGSPFGAVGHFGGLLGTSLDANNGTNNARQAGDGYTHTKDNIGNQPNSSSIDSNNPYLSSPSTSSPAGPAGGSGGQMDPAHTNQNLSSGQQNESGAGGTKHGGHLAPGSHHHSIGVSVHQKNFKQKLIALIKKFRTDGSDFDSEEQYREALERELMKAAAGRGSRAIEELLEEDIDVEGESGSEPEDWDNISETSTPKPSLRPFFSSTTLDKI